MCKQNYKRIAFLLTSILFLATCTTDELSFPATFKFNKIVVEPKGVYAIQNNKTSTLINSNTGSYALIQKQIMEQTEKVVTEFIELDEITLLTEANIRIKGKEQMDSFTAEGNYQIENNLIKISNSNIFDIDNVEINEKRDQIKICGLINWVSGKAPGLPHFSNASIDECISQDPKVIISDLLSNAKTTVYDTISVNVFKWEFNRQ